MRLKDKTALITGGASGIGRATVEKFVREGARVMIVDRDLERAQATANEIAGADAGSETVAAFGADVSVLAEVEAAVQATVETFGRLDIIFNNAGIAGGRRLLEHDPAVDYDPIVRIDQDGVYHGILAAGRQFRAQGTGGVIISTSSIYGEQAAEVAFAYSAAKAAVISFTRSAAYELAEYGVRAVAITPGRVRTPIINQFSDELRDTFAAEQLRGVLTEPEEIANVVAFLASDEANVINGTVVHVDDGYSVFKQRLDLPDF
ncbi:MULTISPECIES: SDR family oxidoreductase [Microbacterium]|jgi:NAD(P)-dependent dehydrogenase (short-subunit alcohol dehydrogenase family)|uniref:SDR family NAD(P)-dependent oxidoreductase n=1 Tax=Microbacterium TaxID=33882 RepID=UPI0023DCD8D4|nr:MULTISPECIES: SDR family oxidoreductase [Microbacterium]MDF2048149.1 SDR family oxidoreductase [Microbacterium sp. Kw_RZR3]MDF2916435.1 Short-chain dehydrogenase/reductase [Microbacterium sp.]MDQ1075511.1 NAD(P)-dependent dehydrogenase (short-subunit alcohol dehydrogenase family) [Microbacterium sp. SORGH_AS_0969]MDQ1115749.1 NAD(P)-dependent dehydrogenase (short-subunit alcohol dehydrogenase family) [Microbacterium testaceum]